VWARKHCFFLWKESNLCVTCKDKPCTFKEISCQASWLTLVILATREAEIRRITVRSQPEANSSRVPILKKIDHKNLSQKKSGSRCRPWVFVSSVNCTWRNPSTEKKKKNFLLSAGCPRCEQVTALSLLKGTYIKSIVTVVRLCHYFPLSGFRT
jgi:hypothetical protein